MPRRHGATAISGWWHGSRSWGSISRWKKRRRAGAAAITLIRAVDDCARRVLHATAMRAALLIALKDLRLLLRDRMALFCDPDGNDLMLHNRYAD